VGDWSARAKTHLLAIARSVGCVDEAGLEKLGDIRSELEKYRQGGMTPKNMKLIRQVLNEKVWDRVYNCPTELMKRARSVKEKAPVKAAVAAQIPRHSVIKSAG
jgi:hypothetical protein